MIFICNFAYIVCCLRYSDWTKKNKSFSQNNLYFKKSEKIFFLLIHVWCFSNVIKQNTTRWLWRNILDSHYIFFLNFKWVFFLKLATNDSWGFFPCYFLLQCNFLWHNMLWILWFSQHKEQETGIQQT